MKLYWYSLAWLGLAACTGGGTELTFDGAPDGAETARERDAGLDAAPAPDPDPGPPGQGVSAGGGRAASARFVLYSITGQATPVGAGSQRSARHTVNPGILGGE